MFGKVLVANRGEIACRIIRTLRRLGIVSVAVYSEADRHSLHVEQADEAVCIGPAPAAQSYLSIPAVVETACKTGAEALHPGYGFLSENADFADFCEARGIVFIGPTAEQIRTFGLKHTARRIAAEQNVPMLQGSGLLGSIEAALAEAERVGYPVMLKSTAGGGGIGMRLCATPAELEGSFSTVARLSQTNFGTAGLFVEQFVSEARHVEVQIFGDGRSSVVALGERDCSLQRRNQKIMEETPAPGLASDTREQLFAAAARLAKSVSYRSAGTVEFLYNPATREFNFLEVNTRLQVEHGVTEEVTGVDLVEWMIRLAAGEEFPFPREEGERAVCSIQARIYAEDPARNFLPSAGRLTQVVWPEGVRVETWIEAGAEVTPLYDPMLAKVIVHGADRETALRKMRQAVQQCLLSGIETNLRYLRQICDHPSFVKGGVSTAFLNDFPYRHCAINVLQPGMQTTIQDYPGRLGYWHVGVPPSGPMDSLALRWANQLVGNTEDAAGLEITLTGPVLHFASDTTIALTGADFGARLDGRPLTRWCSISVPRGAVLELGHVVNGGCRGYLAVAGGFDVPRYLGSRGTFILGKFGGHGGRILRVGDVLHIGEHSSAPQFRQLSDTLIPQYGQDWEIGVLYGPHGAPDFFTPQDIEMLFSIWWRVHYNSDRTGIRLIGPKPRWARADGGEAGLHPSNTHDNAYAVGTIDFTGDMPVILGPDGPSLGGFVCPATIIEAELWKIGQLRAGDRVRFRALSFAQAEEMARALDACMQMRDHELPSLPSANTLEDPILVSHPPSNGAPAVVCRADGDRYLLVEYGPNALDMNLRFRAHFLEHAIRRIELPGIIDITPGVRSLHIHYHNSLGRDALVAALNECERQIPDLDDVSVPSRIVHLPLCWDDPATQLAIQKYMQSVRPDAPWCPSNIEFIRRINGLSSIDEVRRIVFDANYLVLGLGDVYLGAPVATPLDPRHRLVTTKYNPARTWTPENAVGIGGAYLCVYGMEGPGGYQFVGRTLQMWNTFHTTAEFLEGIPWLLRFFDQIRFFPVSASELLEIRDAFPRGRFPLKMDQQEFNLRQYHTFLKSIQVDAAAFKKNQQMAFEAERERWADMEHYEDLEPPSVLSVHEQEATVPEGCKPVRSPAAASIWNIDVEAGQRVEAGQKLIILEAMKSEIVVVAPNDGVVERLSCTPGALVSAGQILLALRPETRS